MMFSIGRFRQWAATLPEKEKKPNSGPDFATQILSLRNAIDDLNIGFQKSVASIVIPHPVTLGEKAFERMDEIVGQLLGIREAVSKLGQAAPTVNLEPVIESLRGWESRSIERHDSLMKCLSRMEAGFVNLTEGQQKEASLLAQHLAAQKQLARTIEGRGDDEDQEVIERAMALKAQYPEMTLEESIARVRRSMVYSQRG